MYQIEVQVQSYPLHIEYIEEKHTKPAREISCGWQPLRAQLLLQWKRLTARDLDEAGPDRYRIALLIQRKYGIASEMVESYLRNFERTMPVMSV